MYNDGVLRLREEEELLLLLVGGSGMLTEISMSAMRGSAAFGFSVMPMCRLCCFQSYMIGRYIFQNSFMWDAGMANFPMRGGIIPV